MNFKRKKTKMNSDLPICRYGSSCYRKNSEHHQKYLHTDTHVDVSEDDNQEDDIDSYFHCATPSNKKQTQQAPMKNRRKRCKNNEQDPMDSYSDCSTSTTEEQTQGLPMDDNVSKDKDLSLKGVNNKVEKKTSIPDDPKQKVSVDKPTLEIKYSETVKEVLDSMPKDFFDFWDFCLSLNKSKPEDAFAELGFHLVGIYDLLSKKMPKDKIINLHCHWRYYYDPPEFQTVVKLDGKDLYHIGYFRDYPTELPSILASNSAKLGHKLTLKGDNIFAAMNFEITEALKKSSNKKLKDKFCNIQDKLKTYASSKRYSLDIQSSKAKARNKQTVTKTFHGLGIVVPIKNDIGYRPLPDSDATVKGVLKRIVSAPNEDKRLEEEENLDELISNVQFANDECDYGMGLELAIDLFCFGNPYFHSHILHLLPLAYDLLKRPKYGEIVRAHLLNRKESDELDILEI